MKTLADAQKDARKNGTAKYREVYGRYRRVTRSIGIALIVFGCVVIVWQAIDGVRGHVAEKAKSERVISDSSPPTTHQTEPETRCREHKLPVPTTDGDSLDWVTVDWKRYSIRPNKCLSVTLVTENGREINAGTDCPGKANPHYNRDWEMVKFTATQPDTWVEIVECSQ